MERSRVGLVESLATYDRNIMFHVLDRVLVSFLILVHLLLIMKCPLLMLLLLLLFLLLFQKK